MLDINTHVLQSAAHVRNSHSGVILEILQESCWKLFRSHVGNRSGVIPEIVRLSANSNTVNRKQTHNSLQNN